MPQFRPAAFALTAVAVLLLVVHRGDRRNAWRYAPDPVEPARSLLPMRQAEQTHVIELAALARPAGPVTLVVAAVDVPTQPVPLPNIPKPRVPVEDLPGVVVPGLSAQAGPTTARVPES